jgi:hypothetical protein
MRLVNIAWIIIISFIAGFVARLLAPLAPIGIAARCGHRGQPTMELGAAARS